MTAVTLLALSCDSPIATQDAGSLIVTEDAGTPIATQDAGIPTSGKDVAINFKFAVNGKPYSCSQTYTGVGNNPDAGAQVFLPSFARFYLHDVKLGGPNGADVPVSITGDGVWQLSDAGVVMISADTGGCKGDAPVHLQVLGTAPEGTYAGLKFKIGLPFAVNHLFVDNQPPPLNDPAMYWSWTNGYRFMKIEGFDAVKKSLPGGLLHLGSAGCVPDKSNNPTSCAFENLVDVAFPTFNIATNSVVLDIGTLFKDTDITVNVSGPPGCMSAPTDPECPPMLKKLGIPYADGLLEDGGVKVVQPTGGQTIFTME